jgi:Flp pilus assembly protein TadG
MRRERGLTTVEFAIIGTVVMMTLFGVIEFGRLMYTIVFLNESTRRAARVAAVCPVNDPAIASAALFGGNIGVPGYGTNNVSVQYLDANSAVLGNPGGATQNVRYVRVSVTGLSFNLSIPLLGATLALPGFPATLPRESLGIVNGVVTGC